MLTQQRWLHGGRRSGPAATPHRSSCRPSIHTELIQKARPSEVYNAKVDDGSSLRSILSLRFCRRLVSEVYFRL